MSSRVDEERVVIARSNAEAGRSPRRRGDEAIQDPGSPRRLRRLAMTLGRGEGKVPPLSRRRWLSSVVAGLIAGGLAVVTPALGFDRSELTIAAADGKQHHFRIELARNPDDRARGLMYRRALDTDAGMLFDFETPQLVSMWMMNTLIPLDMLFIAADGRIATIAERTVPHSTASILSEVPVRGVLELNGGTVARLGIKRGDRVVHPIFEGR